MPTLNKQQLAIMAGVIDRHSIYTLPEVQGRLRFGKQAWRTARKEGFPVRMIGNRKFVLGCDVVEWIQTKPFSPN